MLKLVWDFRISVCTKTQVVFVFWSQMATISILGWDGGRPFLVEWENGSGLG